MNTKEVNERLGEIERRKGEIRGELETADEARMAELEAEVETLTGQERQLRSRLDLAGRLGAPLEKPPFPGATEAEARAAAFRESGRMALSATEIRSTLLSTGAILKPTGVGGINDMFNTVSSIVDQVRVEDLTGMGGYKEAYLKALPEAGPREDGKAQTGSDPVWRAAAINPYLVSVTSYVSREIGRQTPLNYEAKVRECALRALRKKLGGLIVTGAGPSEIYGILNAQNTETVPEDICQTYAVDTAAIDAATLRGIVFSYGGDENLGGSARLYLSKADLDAFGRVRGTSEKKAIYEITPDSSNPNTGTIKDGGLIVPYTINSALTSLSTAVKGDSPIKTMMYGDPQNYKLGLFGDYTVEVSRDYKFAEGLLTVMGEVMVGGNVVVDKGFVVVTLSAG